MDKLVADFNMESSRLPAWSSACLDFKASAVDAGPNQFRLSLTMLTIPLLTIFLLVASAFAIPSPIQLRRAGHYKSRPLQIIETQDISNNTLQVQQSYNWAGIVWNKSPVCITYSMGVLNDHLFQPWFYRGRSSPLRALWLSPLPMPPMAPHPFGSVLMVTHAQAPSFRPALTCTT